jgi:hypothetical protein
MVDTNDKVCRCRVKYLTPADNFTILCSKNTTQAQSGKIASEYITYSADIVRPLETAIR